MLTFRAFLTEAVVAFGGRTLPVVKARQATSDVLVDVLVEPFDRAFARETGFYVGEGGAGGIAGRYDRFDKWIATAVSLEAPEVYVDEDGGVGFSNGRHRYAWLRDHGAVRIPMAMSRRAAKNAKRAGYV
jgi:hypothetical protein